MNKTKPPIKLIPFSEKWVLHEDTDFLIIDKPSGLLSVPGRFADPSASLIGQVQTQYPEAQIVHRLDMDTSGIMVLARNAETHRFLSRQFQDRLTSKQYQALCFGKPSKTEGVINLPMRCAWEKRPLQMIDFKLGKSAKTLWQVTEQLENSFKVNLIPITGRSHQLRLHMKMLGHPILGDNLYADKNAFVMASRLLLHASNLKFTHPRHNRLVEFFNPIDFNEWHRKC